ncbi:tetratricopeptide repeat protein [Nocardia rhamnosiphila]|uniref:ATP-binding protein n=1 Tax=Nocardia rhamnosiphila TaxID=426716 RepID=UPI0033CEA03C
MAIRGTEVGRDLAVHYTVQQQPSASSRLTGTLPRGTETLVGRGIELARIVRAAGPGRVVSVHTVDGMAGIGKTALVTRAAHELAPWFPDGQYFVELHAHTPGQTPADPAEVLARLLVAVGVDSRYLPETLVRRRDLWLDRVAGKRILLVLDDAFDHAQVEPLLPGTGSCLTLITSRRHLTALDNAVPLALDVLDPPAAVDLFLTLAHRPAVTDDERAAVETIVALCGYLPLAIVLLAGRLAHHPAWNILGLADDFAAAHDRLDQLEAGPRAVRVAFTTSYQDLAVEHQRMFRHLGLHPGADFDAHAAAALSDMPVREARIQLEAFYTDHLVEETQPGRYRLHDLVRAYARTKAHADPTTGTAGAIERLMDYYRDSATAADWYVARSTRPTIHSATAPRSPIARQFDDETQALAWMRMERENLLACLDQAAEHSPWRVVELTEVLAGLFECDGPLVQATTLHEYALITARHLEDRLGEANCLTNLGRVREWNGDYSQAAGLYEQALTHYRHLGSRIGQANSLANLGSVRRLTGDYVRAADLHQQALDLYRALGNRVGEAYTLMILGLTHSETSDYAESADLYRHALVLYRQLGNRIGEATTLANLGQVLKHTGTYAESVDLHQQALALFREIRHRPGEADVLTTLGSVKRILGDDPEAVRLYQAAMEIFHETGNRLGQAIALTELGDLSRVAGHHTEAVELHESALQYARELGHRLSEAKALANLGKARKEAGKTDDAASLAIQALALYRDLGHRTGETEALCSLGNLLLDNGDPRNALQMFTDAEVLAHSINSQLERARALEGAAQAHVQLSDNHEAGTALRQAIDIYHQLALPDAERARRALAALHP